MRSRLVLLVVDDDMNDLQLFHAAVRRDGVEVDVHEVRDGQEAVQYLEGERSFADRDNHPFPDLILLDLKMPGMDGFEVLDWLRAHPEYGHVPAVMLSGSGLEQDVEEAYRRGVNTYFAKPTDFKKLMELIRLMVDYWGSSERPRYGILASQFKPAK